MSPAIPAVDITHPSHKANPFPFYEQLRNEAPVYPVRMPDGQTVWLVTRYDDVVSVLKDERFLKNRFSPQVTTSSQKPPWMPAIFKPLMTNMLDSDPPNHTRLRALVQKAFTPSRIEQMRDRIQLLADRLLDEVQSKTRFDLVRDFALPLPATVIAEMLGVPVEDQSKFHRWSTNIVSLNWSKWDMITGIPSVWRFLKYVRNLVKQRRAVPKEDMISALVEVREGGDKLSEDELVAMIFLLLIAGHETTVNLIAGGTLALLQHPDQLEKLRQDPTLIKPAVEELLRFASPLDTATERYASEEITLSGVKIPHGSLVFAVINSANRDERQFANPNQLDITRDPNRHLSFGLGIHFCAGAPLARMEGQIAIQSLVQRVRDFKLSAPAESLKYRGGLVLRSLKSLPLLKQAALQPILS